MVISNNKLKKLSYLTILAFFSCKSQSQVGQSALQDTVIKADSNHLYILGSASSGIISGRLCPVDAYNTFKSNMSEARTREAVKQILQTFKDICSEPKFLNNQELDTIFKQYTIDVGNDFKASFPNFPNLESSVNEVVSAVRAGITDPTSDVVVKLDTSANRKLLDNLKMALANSKLQGPKQTTDAIVLVDNPLNQSGQGLKLGEGDDKPEDRQLSDREGAQLIKSRISGYFASRAKRYAAESEPEKSTAVNLKEGDIINENGKTIGTHRAGTKEIYDNKKTLTGTIDINGNIFDDSGKKVGLITPDLKIIIWGPNGNGL